MGMALAVPRYSVQDLESFPDDGNRYELLDGLLLVTPAPSPGHQAVVSRLMESLQTYLRSSGALVYGPGAVEIEPKHHLEPDILVVPASEPIAQRWSEIRHWWLAVEVSGRGSRVYDRDFKFAAYQALGVLDVWRADLLDRRIVVKTGADEEVSYADRFSWQPEGIDHALTININKLFEGVQGNDC
jgi:Uma2 family endonuclease